MSNTSDFIILKEDHTLGNVITEFLRSMPHVMMAAYKSKQTVNPRFEDTLADDYPQLPILTCQRSCCASRLTVPWPRVMLSPMLASRSWLDMVTLAASSRRSLPSARSPTRASRPTPMALSTELTTDGSPLWRELESRGHI